MQLLFVMVKIFFFFNGQNNNENFSVGCGSGTIYLKAKNIANNGKIEAISGQNGLNIKRMLSFDGGMGRIGIDVNFDSCNEQDRHLLMQQSLIMKHV